MSYVLPWLPLRQPEIHYRSRGNACHDVQLIVLVFLSAQALSSELIAAEEGAASGEAQSVLGDFTAVPVGAVASEEGVPSESEGVVPPPVPELAGDMPVSPAAAEVPFTAAAAVAAAAAGDESTMVCST